MLIVCVLLLGAALPTIAANGESPTGSSSTAEFPVVLRRPIAMQFSPDEKLLYVANRQSGSISVLDVGGRTVIQEVVIGEQISDFVHFQDDQYLATDERRHALLLLRIDGRKIRVERRVAVPPYPVSISISPDLRGCTVASLWSRQLSFVDLSVRDVESKVTKVLDLPFAPRCQVHVPQLDRLIVADSFSGRLGIIDLKSREFLFVREFPAHNIRGLQISSNGRMLVVAHQMLNELAHTIRNDVHWGLLMSNDLRWLRLDSVLNPGTDLYSGGHMHPLGQAGHAAGDPAALAVARDGRVVVAIGGVGEIAVGREDEFSLYRIEVGRRPTALAVTRDSRLAFAANTFGDSVSIVDLVEREQLAEIRLGASPELNLVQRGEELFYNADVSHDGWMSCHSCHTDGHTNGLVNDNFTDKTFGSAKQVLSLLGRKGTAPFAWNASSANLSEQIRKSIVNTMQGASQPKDDDVAALEAYLDSLPPPPSIDVLRGTSDPSAIRRGQLLFAEQNCVRCHAPPIYTTPQTYDVGLEDKQGNREFNPPSLLGVGQRGPYFHDNRAATLAEVFHTYHHQLKRDLSESELSDLLAFLRSL